MSLQHAAGALVGVWAVGQVAGIASKAAKKTTKPKATRKRVVKKRKKPAPRARVRK